MGDEDLRDAGGVGNVSAADPFDLERFVRAQDGGGHHRAVAELRAARKTGHWMWWELPQLVGLGHSPASQHYGISSLEEARAYLAHPVLGPRLRECCEALLTHDGVSAEQVLGSVDAVKLRSSMTLFALVAPHDGLFDRVLERYFGGERDPLTLDLL